MIAGTFYAPRGVGWKIIITWWLFNLAVYCILFIYQVRYLLLVQVLTFSTCITGYNMYIWVSVCILSFSVHHLFKCLTSSFHLVDHLAVSILLVCSLYKETSPKGSENNMSQDICCNLHYILCVSTCSKLLLYYQYQRVSSLQAITKEYQYMLVKTTVWWRSWQTFIPKWFSSETD